MQIKPDVILPPVTPKPGPPVGVAEEGPPARPVGSGQPEGAGEGTKAAVADGGERLTIRYAKFERLQLSSAFRAARGTSEQLGELNVALKQMQRLSIDVEVMGTGGSPEHIRIEALRESVVDIEARMRVTGPRVEEWLTDLGEDPNEVDARTGERPGGILDVLATLEQLVSHDDDNRPEAGSMAKSITALTDLIDRFSEITERLSARLAEAEVGSANPGASPVGPGRFEEAQGLAEATKHQITDAGDPARLLHTNLPSSSVLSRLLS